MLRHALILVTIILAPLPPTSASLAGPKKSGADACVVLARARGALVLVNRCRACRAVALERRSDRGKSDRDTYFVAPVSMVPVPPRGAGNIKILSERSCRRGAALPQPPASPVQPASTVAASVSVTSGRCSGGRPST